MGKKQIIITYVRPSSQAIKTHHQERAWLLLRGGWGERMGWMSSVPGISRTPKGQASASLLTKNWKNCHAAVRGGLPLWLTFLNVKGGAGLRLLLQEGRREEWSIISAAQDFHNVAWGASNTALRKLRQWDLTWGRRLWVPENNEDSGINNRRGSWDN